MKLPQLLEDAPDFVWADVGDQEMVDGAWAIAEESSINILSDKELRSVIVRNTPHRESSSEDVVGASFSSVRKGGSVYSFDIVVDPTYQGKGIGRMLFNEAMADVYDSGYEMIELEVVNAKVAQMAEKAGFTHVGGRVYEKILT